MPSQTRALPMTSRLAGGGLIGALGLAGAVTIVAAFVAGGAGVLSAVGAALLVIIYFGAGQLVERFALQLADATGLTITLFGYIVRVVLLGVLLWASMSTPAIRAAMIPTWVAAGAIAAVFGWLTGVLVRHARSRVAIYDRPYEAPQGWDEQ